MRQGPRRQATPPPYPIDRGPLKPGIGGWLARGLALVVGVMVLAAALFLGVVFFFVMLGLFALFALVGLAKVWSFRRHMRRAAREASDTTVDGARRGRGWVQTEYTVMREDGSGYQRRISRRSFGDDPERDRE